MLRHTTNAAEAEELHRALVAQFLGLLTKDAMQWTTAVSDKTTQVTDYDQFFSMFQHGFDHAPEGKAVSTRLLSLKQGLCRVIEYALEFRTLAAESGWNEPALKAVFL